MNLVRLRSLAIVSILTFCTAVLVGVTTQSSDTSALSEAQRRMFAENNILFYDPESGSNSCNFPTGSFDGNSSAGLSDLQAAFVDKYHEIAVNLSIQYGIPWETVVAQGVLESTAGTSHFAIERNNFFGLGAYDSNPDHAFKYDSPTEGWKGYYEVIRKTSTYRLHGVFQEPTITDPYAYLAAIKAAGYATDPNYIPKVSKLISAIENRSSLKSWPSSKTLAMMHFEMFSNAAKNAAGVAPSNNPFLNELNNSSLCIRSGDGSINSTAIAFSWPDRFHSSDDPNPLYQKALLAQNDISTGKVGDSCSKVGKSCDAFVVTVLRSSGADSQVPCCGAANVLSYFKQHPDLYQEIPNLGNSSNLQPGDIRASSSHVEIYVQLSDGSYRIASASHCDRTADHGVSYYPDTSYRIFRRKQ